MAQGIRIDLNGETVFETDDNVLEVIVGSDKGESARIGVRESSVNRIYLKVVKEDTLNKHLDAVDREKVQARREANAASDSAPVEEEESQGSFTLTNNQDGEGV